MSSLIWQALVTIACLSNLICGGTARNVTEITTVNPISCPDTKNSREPVYFPHPVDCQLYYVCDSGLARLQKCQPGLHFNPSLKACDYPQEAGCERDVSLKPKGRIVEEEFEACPAGNPKHPVLLPHPTDCGNFYICNHGSPHLQKCQSGLHFNRKLKACDYPENAGCEKEKPKGREAENDEESGMCPKRNSDHPVLLPHPTDCTKFYICNHGSPHEQRCQSGLHFNPKLKACDYPKTAGCEKGVSEKPKGRVVDDGDLKLCPAENSEIPVYFRHPSDCSKFFICDNGSPHLQTCQRGLHFNLKTKYCDYPENVGCDKGITKKPRGKYVEEDGVVSCPAINIGVEPVLLPHPTECDKFFVCDNGKAHLRSCQRGLSFNPRLQYCDYPENTDCRMQGVLAGPGFPSPYCPSQNGKVPIFYRHDSNCSIYYMCNHGFAYEFACPARLHFNLRTRQCDYETNARCSNNG